MNLFNSIRDNTTRQKLREMIFELYPQYNYVRIKRNGEIVLKANWWSLKRDRISSFKLCTDPNHLPGRISNYATRMISVEYDLESLLKHLVSVRLNETYPIIDRLHLEFSQIKYSKIWSDYNLRSIEPVKPVTMPMLIRMSKTDSLPSFIRHDIQNVAWELKRLLNTHRFLPVTTSQ